MANEDIMLLAIGGIAGYFLLSTCTLQKMLANIPDVGEQIVPMVDQLAAALGITCQVTPTTPTTTTTTPQQGTGVITPQVAPGGEIFLNVSINNSQKLGLQFDSGATVSVISQDLANIIGLSTANPIRMQNITTVSGPQQAAVVAVTMQIENAAAFQTEVAVMSTSFNLLSRNDLNKVYDISITGTATTLTPRAAFYAYTRTNARPYSRRSLSL